MSIEYTGEVTKKVGCMEVRPISLDEKNVVEDVISIHLEAFKGFFLSFMGRGFLRQMYSSYCEHDESELLVAFDESEKAIGFIAYSGNMSGLYKYMLRKKIIKFAWYAFGAFLRRPSIFVRLVRALLRPREAKRKEQYVELASIGISPNSRAQGVGTNMITSLKNRVDFSKYEYITLDTDSINNEGVNSFYIKNGFSLFREYCTPEGRKMNEYRYDRR